MIDHYGLHEMAQSVARRIDGFHETARTHAMEIKFMPAAREEIKANSVMAIRELPPITPARAYDLMPIDASGFEITPILLPDNAQISLDI